jgi:hypothetical protein
LQQGDRLVAEVFNEGRLKVLDELYEPGLATRARAWIAPFRDSFSDLKLEIVQLIAEGDAVAARFNLLGHPFWCLGSVTPRRTDDSRRHGPSETAGADEPGSGSEHRVATLGRL